MHESASFDAAVQEAGIDPDYTPVDIALQFQLWGLYVYMTGESDDAHC